MHPNLFMLERFWDGLYIHVVCAKRSQGLWDFFNFLSNVIERKTSISSQYL